MESQELTNMRAFVIASRQRGTFGATFLKMDGRTGDFKAGKANKNMNGVRLLAETPDAMCGHQRIERGQKPIYCIGRVADGFQPLEREQLGDTDSRLWIDPENDPWQEVSMLPMLDLENREIFLFTTSSDGGRDAVATLLDGYLDNLKNHPDDSAKQPLVTLANDNYTNAGGKKIFFPVFEIDGWAERPPALRHIKPPPLDMLTIKHSDTTKTETEVVKPQLKIKMLAAGGGSYEEEVPF
jgi:hypothetical protein